MFRSSELGDELQALESEVSRLLNPDGEDIFDAAKNRAYYACGAVWSLALEAAQRARTGGDFFDVVAEFQRRNADDMTVTREEWLTLLTDVSRDPSLRIGIERMLDEGAVNPAGEIAHLFERTGVAFRMEGDRLVLVGGQAAPNE